MVNPYNTTVVKDHLVCAAAELPLDDEEPWLREEPVRSVLEQLTETGDLMKTADGGHYHSRYKRPRRKVDLRSAGERYRIICDADLLGEINAHRLYHETHPGAIYYHQSRVYKVMDVDCATHTVSVRPAKVTYHTRVRTDIDLSILKSEKRKYIGNTVVYYGRLQVTDQVLGYDKISAHNGQVIGRSDLAVPPVAWDRCTPRNMGPLGSCPWWYWPIVTTSVGWPPRFTNKPARPQSFYMTASREAPAFAVRPLTNFSA